MLEKGKKRTRKQVAPGVAAPQGTASAGAGRGLSPAATQAPSRPGPISPEARRQMIAEAAYFRAQRREFRGGDPDRDWIEAEAEIDALLLNRR